MPEAAGPVGPPGDLVGDRASARAAVRAVRGGTHTAGWGQLLQDWYVGAFVTATLLTLLFAATGPSILRPDCAATCLSGTQHRWMAVAMGLLGAVAAAAEQLVVRGETLDLAVEAARRLQHLDHADIAGERAGAP